MPFVAHQGGFIQLSESHFDTFWKLTGGILTGRWRRGMFFLGAMEATIAFCENPLPHCFFENDSEIIAGS